MSIDDTLQHGRDYRGEDLSGWLVSEKLDGCFGCWTGSEMLARGGAVVQIPGAWRAVLPKFRVFGEIHAGRGGFQQARVAVQNGRFNQLMRFDIFDAPFSGTWLERMAHVRSAMNPNPHVGIITAEPAASTRAAFARMNAILAEGGEGIMARHPGNLWQPGRTFELLKLKNPACAALVR